MEDHLHQKDHLDDFVQKSFEGYEEAPSSGMWNRIEGALETPVLRSRWFGPAKHWWSVAAAVLFVMLGWAGICTYYERKITALETTLSNPRPAQKSWSPEMDTLVAQKVAEWMTAQQETENNKAGAPLLATQEILDLKTAKKEVAKRIGAMENPKSNFPITAANISRFPGKPKQAKDHAENDSQRATQDKETIAQKSETEPGNALNAIGQQHKMDHPNTTTIGGMAATNGREGIPNPLAPAVENALNQTVAPKPVDILALEYLQSRKTILLTLEPLTANTPAMLPTIRPHRSLSGWYVGLRATPVFSKENAMKKPAKPIERPINGPRPSGRTPVFANDANQISWSADWGLAVGKKINRQLSFETGIAFANIRQESVHEAKFQFRDVHHHSPTMDHRFDFDYNLNTYGGSAAVSLRMEQVDRANPIPLTEPLIVKITTKQQSMVLKIPLLAAFTFGSGALHGVVKVGPEGHFNVSNQLEVDVLTSLNSKFRPDPATMPPPVFETKRRFSLGYRASAGLGYRVSRYVSVVAEPIISGTFAQTDQLKQQLPGNISAGINLGVNYHF